MKTTRILKTMLWSAALMLLISCGASGSMGRHSGKLKNESKSSRTASVKKSKKEKADKKVQSGEQTVIAEEEAPARRDTLNKEEFLQQVTTNAQTTRFITSKVKFTVEVGTRQMTMTGNLKMKRDDVIRLQLMAFGFVEAGRLEFTKEYVLIVDRINKQYLKVPYGQLDFLRNSGIDFYMLQALFWNELFQPGSQKLTERQMRRFQADYGVDDEIIVAIENGKLSYRWLTDSNNARIKMANVLYADRYRGNYQLNWDYEDFKVNDRKFFPRHHVVRFNSPDHEVKFDMYLNYMGNDEDWETRTSLSGKYRQMPVDDILRRFMSL